MQSLLCHHGFPQSSQFEESPSTITVTALNTFLSPLLRLPPHIRRKIFTFALGGHHIRIYFLNGRSRPRVCPECYFGLPYALSLGRAVPVSVLLVLNHVSRQIYLEAQGLAFAHNDFIGYPTPLAALFKRMAPWQANAVQKVTVSVLVPFKMLVDNKTVTGLSEEVVEVLRMLGGMRGLQRVSVEWDGKHDNHGEAHDYFKTKVKETFGGHDRKHIIVRVPMLGMKL